jgi:hypothetical protein
MVVVGAGAVVVLTFCGDSDELITESGEAELSSGLSVAARARPAMVATAAAALTDVFMAFSSWIRPPWLGPGG